MTRAFGYLRVSGKGQLDGDGYPRQLAAIEKYAAAHDLNVVRFFEEQGVSGTTGWEDRPAWVELVAALTPQTKTIVIERLDRLARELGLQEYILRDLGARGIVLFSTAEPDLGSSDPTRVLFRQIIGAVSQYDRAMIEAKLRAARERMRRRGEKCEGRYPWGSHPDKPSEVEVLELMLRWHAEGYTFNEISIKLNEGKVSTRDSGKWYGATVSRIIKREVVKRA
jgi:DNA invertase Pin-like site-specific DNA recombinase